MHGCTLRGMPRRRAAIFALVLLAASAFASLWRLYPRIDPANTPVSLENLKRHVTAIATEPHPVGSRANQRVRDYILGELAVLGLEPQVQAGLITNSRGREFYVENIVCRLVAPRRTETVPAALLVSHYDSHPRAPGAGDDGHAVACMLEIARLLAAAPPPRRDIVLLFTDGEEYGLLGAQAWVRDNPDLMGCRVVANFEARGSSGPAIMFETAGAPIDLFYSGYAHRSPHPVTSSLASPVYERLDNDTDFTVFKLAGMAGLNFAFIGRVHNYHQPGDSPENLSDASLLHQAAQMHEVARYFATAGEAAFAKNLGEGGLALIYFDVLALWMVSYPAHLSRPLALLAAVVAGAGIWRLRPRSSRVGPALIRLPLGLLFVVGAAAVTMFLRIPTQKLYLSPLAFAAAGALALAVLPLAAARGRRDERACTALTLAMLALGALATGFFFPPGSYVLLVPGLALGVAALAPLRWHGTAFALAAAGSTITLLPLAWLVMEAMTIRLLAAPAAMLVLITWLWRPAVAPLLRARWRIAVALTTLGAVAFAMVFLP